MRKSAWLKWIRSGLLVAALLATALASALPAWAQTFDQWEIRLTELGYNDPVRLSGSINSTEVYIPVPEGLRPAYFKTQLHRSPEIQGGVLEIQANDRTIATYNLGDLDQSTQLVVSLQNVPSRDTLLHLRIQSYLQDEVDICTAALAGMWLELADAAVTFEGQPSLPQTVGAFFPPVLKQVTFYTSSPPTPAEAAAVLQLGAALTRRYLGQKPNLRVEALAAGETPTVSASPFARSIVVQETGMARTEVVGPVLYVAGYPEALRTQSRVLADGLTPLLAVPSFVGLTFQSPEEIGDRQITFATLGYAERTLSGIGRLEIPLYFTQADLGGPVKALSLRLLGTYSPIPEGGNAVLHVLFNGALLQAVSLDQKGAFDLHVNVPAPLVQRDNTVVLRVDYTPPGGECRVGRFPITFYLDPRSYIQFERGQTLSPGFERFPQVLLPSFDVAFDALDVPALRGAVDLIKMLQEAAGRRPLRPSLVSLDEALRANKAVLIVGTSLQGLESLSPPVLPAPFRVTDPENQELLRFEAAAQFGALEAFEHNRRDVLLLTAYGDRNLLHATTQSLVERPQGWRALVGDVYLYPAQGTPAMVRVRQSGVRVESLTAQAPSWWRQARPFVFIALLALLLGLVEWAYPKLVRRRLPTQ